MPVFAEFPATLARHLGLSQLYSNAERDLVDAPGRANAGDKMMTLVASALAGGDCIDDADALRAGGTDLLVSAAHGQGAIHPGHFPAQLSLGPCPSPARPGEPRVAGPGLSRRGGTRRCAVHHATGDSTILVMDPRRA